MALPNDYLRVVADVVDSDPGHGEGIPSRRDKAQAKRVQALNLRLAGLTYAQIAERLAISEGWARTLVHNSLERAEEEGVETLRNIENERLDIAQRNIWGAVLQGDPEAIKSFLAIHDRRARINGLNAPTRIDMSVTMRREVEEALEGLERLVLEGEVVQELPTSPPTPTMPLPSPRLAEKRADINESEVDYELDNDWVGLERGGAEEAAWHLAEPRPEGAE